MPSHTLSMCSYLADSRRLIAYGSASPRTQSDARSESRCDLRITISEKTEELRMIDFRNSELRFCCLPGRSTGQTGSNGSRIRKRGWLNQSRYHS